MLVLRVLLEILARSLSIDNILAEKAVHLHVGVKLSRSSPILCLCADKHAVRHSVKQFGELLLLLLNDL